MAYKVDAMWTTTTNTSSVDSCQDIGSSRLLPPACCAWLHRLLKILSGCQKQASKSVLISIWCVCDRSQGHAGALQRNRFALSLMKSVTVVTKRQITLMLRDSALTRGRFMQVCPCLLWHGFVAFFSCSRLPLPTRASST